jgi:hypothetical protein
MASLSLLTKQVLIAKDGDTLTTKRRANQSKENFSSALQQAKQSWRNRYGILSSFQVNGDTATITILRALDASPEATKLEVRAHVAIARADVPAPTPVAAAPVVPALPAPPAEPAIVVTDEEGRAFYRTVYLQSLQLQPFAPAEFHAKTAKGAVLEWQRAFPEG